MRRRRRRERSSEQEEAARAKVGYEERDSSDEKTMMFRRAKATRNNAWCWCLTIEVSSRASIFTSASY
jgi:hypothetical protein